MERHRISLTATELPKNGKCSLWKKREISGFFFYFHMVQPVLLRVAFNGTELTFVSQEMAFPQNENHVR